MDDFQTSISFTVNGERFTVNNEYPAGTSLLDFLRHAGISTGTKALCGEGGCGVCLVSVTRHCPLTGKARTQAVNSCCLQLYSCDGVDITTIEGLGSTRSGLHPIQERMTRYDGAQCGYCTPGQIINMHGLLKKNPRPTMKEVEDTFDSTICRCTGYRAILDAMKSFAVDAPASLNGGVIDIEDLDGKICPRAGKPCDGHCKNVSGSTGDNCSDHVEHPVKITTPSGQWLKPVNLAQLFAMMSASDNTRLVFGNTGSGMVKNLSPRNDDTFIDISSIKELYTVDLTGKTHITLGAGLTLTNVKEIFETTTDSTLPYAKTFADYILLIASSGIRNLASWAGNLMLKHDHPNFPSDVVTLLETVHAKLTIAEGSGAMKQFSLTDFLSLNMKGKVIVAMQLPKYQSSDVFVRVFKTSKRLQQSQAYVTSGFNFNLDVENDYMVKSKPTIVVQGFTADKIHATKTEEYLTNKKLGDPNVLEEALKILSDEIPPDNVNRSLVTEGSYRKSLVVGHFYKFVLGVCKDHCDHRLVTGGLDLERPVSSATQDYGPPNPDIFPVSQPMGKLTAGNLTTGEIKFINDLPPVRGQLFAALVLSTQGNAKIDKIDPSKALQRPGVVKFLQASDIPGQNNWRHPSTYGTQKEELLTTGQVDYAGQPIGAIVAEDEKTAMTAAKEVEVTYKDVQPVIVDVMDAIQQKSFFPKLGPYTKGDAEAAMKDAPHRVKGTAQCGEQYHFHLESQAAVCTPTDTGGMDFLATSQWLDASQESLAQVLGLPLSSVSAEVQRLGGSFGGKTMANFPVAGICAVAAYNLKRPVKLSLDLNTNMQFQGRRQEYYFEYEIGFDDNGKLQAIIATGYGTAGAHYYELDCNETTQWFIDGGYFCPNWIWTVQPCKLHRPVCTPCRGPGSVPALFAMECMIDHVATYLNIDQLAVRKVNLLQNGQTMLAGMLVEHCLLQEVVQQLEAEIQYAQRKKAVEDFNKANRWRKRGLHVTPSRYSMIATFLCYNTTVNIYHGDGSVAIAHGAVDMGQGINTKIIQTCAYKLGIPVDKIRVTKTSTVTSANSHLTGGSICAELVCSTVMKCCDLLHSRMASVKDKLNNPTWQELVQKSFESGVNLTAQLWPNPEDMNIYNCYTACCTEVELDVLTGQYQILQVDYLYDCGISLNPRLDIGQVEGGFIMGCGLFLLEGMTYDPSTGKALNDGTWTYKPPMTKDLPIKMNVKFLRNAPNPVGILGAKAVGEAPVAVGSCPLFALKRAVEATRQEVGQSGWFPLHAPATIDKLQQACLNDISLFTLGKQK